MKLPSINQIINSILDTFKRFPLAIITSLLGTALAIYSIKTSTHDDWIMRLILTTSLSASFFTALSLGSEFIDKISRNFVMLLGVILMAIHYFILPEKMDSVGTIYTTRQIFLSLGCFIAILWAPFWKEKSKNEVIWEWVRKIIMNIVQTVFFGVVLFAGISAAIFAIVSLFGLDIYGEIYLEIWVSIVGAFGPIFFLGNLDKNPRKLTLPKPIPTFMNILTKYILTPLAVGYFLILYVYTFKVFITWEWPKNLLSWLVIGFSVVAVFTYFLWTPFWKTKIEKYRRLFWWGLLPQIAMLFIAIFWRIKTYSWTENRYFVVALGLWLLGITIYFLVNKKATFKSIFIALTGVILVSQIGPLSGYNVGKISQQSRLKNLLENSQILQNGIVTTTKIKLDKKIRYKISDSIEYLSGHYGKESLGKILPNITKEILADKTISPYSFAKKVTEKLGFDFVNNWEYLETTSENKYHYFHAKYNSPKDTENHKWFIPTIYKNIKNKENQFIKLGEREIEIKLKSRENFLEIWENEQLIEKIDFTDFFNDLIERSDSINKKDVDPEELSYKYNGNKLNAKIFFPSVSLKEGEVQNFEVQIYLSFK